MPGLIQLAPKTEVQPEPSSRAEKDERKIQSAMPCGGSVLSMKLFPFLESAVVMSFIGAKSM